MKILTIVGARPQFIKAAILSKAFALHQGIDEVMVHTGQHFDDNMSGVFFREMELRVPTYNLGISGTHHGTMTGEMLSEIENVCLKEQPDLLLVFGDTNSTLAGALAAAKLGIPVAHVEAGLRSFNNRMPEEINRIVTDRISDFLFCPTQTAVDNLVAEGTELRKSKIVLSGDVMLDAMNYYASKAGAASSILSMFDRSKGYVLCTVHRAGNTDDTEELKNIINAVNRVHKSTPVVLPLHPRTRKKMAEAGLTCDAIMLEPVGYFDMIVLLQNSKLVLTDSGGLQKEAFFSKKPCVTMRNETEWTELIDGGFNMLAGTDPESIVRCCREMLVKNLDFDVELYGKGNACSIIAESILHQFSSEKQ